MKAHTSHKVGSPLSGATSFATHGANAKETLLATFICSVSLGIQLPEQRFTFIPCNVFHLKQPLFNYQIPSNVSSPGNEQSKDVAPYRKRGLQKCKPTLATRFGVRYTTQRPLPHTEPTQKRRWWQLLYVQSVWGYNCL